MGLVSLVNYFDNIRALENVHRDKVADEVDSVLEQTIPPRKSTRAAVTNVQQKQIENNKIPHQLACSECKQSFKRKHDLVNHMRMHTDPDNCRCEFCGIVYTRVEVHKRKCPSNPNNYQMYRLDDLNRPKAKRLRVEKNVNEKR